jgi:outer membrane receptor protein involved in Fe transport
VGDPGITDLAFFLQDEVRFGDRVRATVGARLDSHAATGAESELTVNPKLSAVYLPSDRISIRASVARGYRAPSVIEQFVSTVQYGIQVVPNPELVGERAWSSEIGVTGFPRRNIRLEGALFYSDYDDLIGPGIAPGQIFVFQFQNVSQARVSGLDFGIRASFANDMVDVQGSYLYLDSEDLATGQPLPYRSRHNVTGTLNLLRGLLGADLRFRSRVEAVLAFPADPRGNITTVDLRAAYRVGAVAIQAKARNLFNTFYTDVQERNPGAPRSIGITLFTEF